MVGDIAVSWAGVFLGIVVLLVTVLAVVKCLRRS